MTRDLYPHEVEAKHIQQGLCPLCARKMRWVVSSAEYICVNTNCPVQIKAKDWHQEDGYAFAYGDVAQRIARAKRRQ